MMTRARLVKANHRPSGWRRFAGMRASSVSDTVGWNRPSAAALIRLPASAVTNTSAGLFTPSALMRSMSAPALSSMTFTVTPAVSSNAS